MQNDLDMDKLQSFKIEEGVQEPGLQKFKSAAFQKKPNIIVAEENKSDETPKDHILSKCKFLTGNKILYFGVVNKGKKKRDEEKRREDSLKKIKKRLNRAVHKIEDVDSHNIRYFNRNVNKKKLKDDKSKTEKYDTLMMKFYDKENYLNPFHFFLKKWYAIDNVELLSQGKIKKVRLILNERQNQFDYAFHQYLTYLNFYKLIYATQKFSSPAFVTIDKIEKLKKVESTNSGGVFGLYKSMMGGIDKLTDIGRKIEYLTTFSQQKRHSPPGRKQL